MSAMPCRSCGALIFWATTTKLKRMPVDAEPTADGNLILGEPKQPFPQYPTVMVLGPGDTPKPGVERYTSHFATCPQAATHRRSRS
jgi:hypothetical protein